jgi:hypothetical protein
MAIGLVTFSQQAVVFDQKLVDSRFYFLPAQMTFLSILAVTWIIRTHYLENLNFRLMMRKHPPHLMLSEI